MPRSLLSFSLVRFLHPMFSLMSYSLAYNQIQSDQPDLHSGMQGGVVSEPLVDMVRLLASLTDADGRIRIPGFLNDVRKLGAEESELYDAVINRCTGLVTFYLFAAYN